MLIVAGNLCDTRWGVGGLMIGKPAWGQVAFLIGLDTPLETRTPKIGGLSIVSMFSIGGIFNWWYFQANQPLVFGVFSA